MQLLSEKPQLDVVQQMLEHMAEPQPLQGTATMETLYCAKFHDQMWYRCKVTELLPDQVRDPGKQRSWLHYFLNVCNWVGKEGSD